MTEYQREQEIKTLLNAHLVLPALNLHKAFPDCWITAKGYESLLDNAYEAIKEYLKD
jgi:hypothetical protein